MKGIHTRGFSLIEVMIALGLLSIGGYFLMELAKTGSMSQKTLLAQDDARSLTDNMAQMLSDPTACADTFGRLDPVAGNGSSLTGLKDKSGKVQFSTGQTYGNRGVQLDGLVIGGAGNDPKTLIPRWAPGTTANTGAAYVQVDWRQTGSTGNQGSGPQHLYRYFIVYVANMSGNQIISCTASTGSGVVSGSAVPNFLALWKTVSSLKESVIFQDPSSGNIGIGTASPAATLEVNGGIRPGHAGVTTGGSCSPEGALAYDMTTAHAPVFCNSSGLWTGIGGAPPPVPVERNGPDVPQI